jgi:hypothetical protein
LHKRLRFLGFLDGCASLLALHNLLFFFAFLLCGLRGVLLHAWLLNLLLRRARARLVLCGLLCGLLRLRAGLLGLLCGLLRGLLLRGDGRGWRVALHHGRKSRARVSRLLLCLRGLRPCLGGRLALRLLALLRLLRGGLLGGALLRLLRGGLLGGALLRLLRGGLLGGGLSFCLLARRGGPNLMALCGMVLRLGGLRLHGLLVARPAAGFIARRARVAACAFTLPALGLPFVLLWLCFLRRWPGRGGVLQQRVEPVARLRGSGAIRWNGCRFFGRRFGLCGLNGSRRLGERFGSGGRNG